MPTLVSENDRISRELLTDAEFLDRLQPGQRADLIDGTIDMHSPVSIAHARLTNFLDRLIAGWLETTGFGGELFREMVAIRLSQRTVLMPDLAWFDNAHVALLAPAHAPIAPQWVAEILSPSTARRDTGSKFAAYEEHGVEEYWVLDPDTLAHRFYKRNQGYFVEFGRDAEWIESQALAGFRVRREWLDPHRPPKAGEALKEILATLG